jgi:hypothetical protein
MCRCSVRLRSKHPRLLCAGGADLQGEEDRVNNRRVDAGSSEEEDTQDYIPPYTTYGPGLVVLASAYIPSTGLPVRPSPVYIIPRPGLGLALPICIIVIAPRPNPLAACHARPR